MIYVHNTISCLFNEFFVFFFFFNDTATTEIYTLSLHDALPIPRARERGSALRQLRAPVLFARHGRSEEHTSELQSRQYVVCRLLLEKKKNLLKPDELVPERPGDEASYLAPLAL